MCTSMAELHWQIHLRHMPICWHRQKTKGYWDDANSNASPDPRPIFITKPCCLLLLSNNSGKGCFFRERKRDVAPFTCTYGGAKHRLSSWNNTEWWQPFALSAASPCSFHPRYVYRSVLSNWEFFIKMRAALLALSNLHDSRNDGGTKDSSHFDYTLSIW